MSATKTAPVTTAALLDRLRRHYLRRPDLPGGIFLDECGLNGASGRRVDAVHVGFTATSGRILRGHEIKVSRSDWLTELGKVDKASTWADACHEWWLVVSDPAIVHEGELPPGWGLMAPNPRGGIKVLTRAERKPSDHQPPWFIVRSIMARLDTLQAQERSRMRAELREELRAEAAKQAREDRSPSVLDQATRDRLEALSMIERQLGVEITSDWWSRAADAVTPTRFAGALDLAIKYGQVTDTDRIRNLARTAEYAASQAVETAEELAALVAYTEGRNT